MRCGSAIASGSRSCGAPGQHKLAAYIEYWQLLGRIRSAEPKAAADVAQFMRRHADTYIADRLRFDWALVLASQSDYQGFEREAAQLAWWTDDAQFRCYLALSKYRRATQAGRRICGRSAAATRKHEGLGRRRMSRIDRGLACRQSHLGVGPRAGAGRAESARCCQARRRARDAGGRPVDQGC